MFNCKQGENKMSRMIAKTFVDTDPEKIDEKVNNYTKGKVGKFFCQCTTTTTAGGKTLHVRVVFTDPQPVKEQGGN